MTSELEVPAVCRELGLNCKRCTEDTARSLAAVCKGLRGKAINKLFHQIYPVSACSPMSAHFVRAYKAASLEASEAMIPIASVDVPAHDTASPAFERREMGLFPGSTAYPRKPLAVAS